MIGMDCLASLNGHHLARGLVSSFPIFSFELPILLILPTSARHQALRSAAEGTAACRSSRRADLDCASHWCGLSYYENDYARICHHLETVNTIEQQRTAWLLHEREQLHEKCTRVRVHLESLLAHEVCLAHTSRLSRHVCDCSTYGWDYGLAMCLSHGRTTSHEHHTPRASHATLFAATVLEHWSCTAGPEPNSACVWSAHAEKPARVRWCWPAVSPPFASCRHLWDGAGHRQSRCDSGSIG